MARRRERCQELKCSALDLSSTQPDTRIWIRIDELDFHFAYTIARDRRCGTWELRSRISCSFACANATATGPLLRAIASGAPRQLIITQPRSAPIFMIPFGGNRNPAQVASSSAYSCRHARDIHVALHATIVPNMLNNELAVLSPAAPASLPWLSSNSRSSGWLLTMGLPSGRTHPLAPFNRPMAFTVEVESHAL
jgi:hypothetical protein